MAKQISKARFDIFAIGTRNSRIQLFTKECTWWADLNEQVIGTVLLDAPDDLYNWIMLVRDENQKFRCVKASANYPKERLAEAALRIAIAEKACDAQFNGTEAQNDNLGNGVQLITPIDPDKNKWHVYYRELINSAGREPGRKVIWEIGNWLFPKDQHFVKEFQLSHFDQRIWEIYLWAAFREMGYDVVQHEAPDFQCLSPMIEIDFNVEATTVAPSSQGVLADHPNPKTPHEFEMFLRTYMPIKFASALTSKLNKRNANGQGYWQHDHTRGKPFILAIADFHKAADRDQFPLGSMTYSQSALWLYLYGSLIDGEYKNGELIIRTAKLEELRFKSKTIPAGFFELADSEHISGVLFSNAGTIAKFDRMGVVAGFAAKDHDYYRTGFRFDPDPNAFIGTYFNVNITDKKYTESWCDELQFFHNPKAKYPMPIEWLPNVAQHYFVEGTLHTLDTKSRVLSSITTILHTAS